MAWLLCEEGGGSIIQPQEPRHQERAQLPSFFCVLAFHVETLAAGCVGKVRTNARVANYDVLEFLPLERLVPLQGDSRRALASDPVPHEPNKPVHLAGVELGNGVHQHHGRRLRKHCDEDHELFLAGEGRAEAFSLRAGVGGDHSPLPLEILLTELA